MLVSQQLHSIVLRVPVTGGTTEQVTNEMDWGIIAVGDNVMYVSYPLSPMQPPYPRRIVTMTADGTTQQVLVDNLPQWDSPQYSVLDRGELFWTGTYQNGILFRMPVTGGTPVALGSVGYEPFGVTADSIVYGFTTTDYMTMPR